MPRPVSGKQEKGPGRKRKGQLTIAGLAASPGLVMGKATVIGHGAVNIPDRKLNSSQLESEIERFRSSLNATRQQCIELRDRLRNKLKEKSAAGSGGSIKEP